MRRRAGGAAGRYLAGALAIAAASCGSPPSPPLHDGPVVVVTLGGVRADSVGFLGQGPPGLTPSLDALASQADWAGAAVAPSSVGLVSLASYATGLTPWTHGVAFGERPLELPAGLPTLAEVLGEQGYRSAGYAPAWLVRAGGWERGFGFLRDLAGGGRAVGHLASLEGGRDFLWIHLGGAEAPWRRRDDPTAQLPGVRTAELPERLSQAELEALRDPDSSSGEAARSAATALYRLSLAEVDGQLGELLAALDESGQRDDTLLVVASTHGQELAAPVAWGLAREHLEVPLIIDLPTRLAGTRSLSVTASRPAAAGLWATIVERVGGSVAPASIPSLASASTGVLSELYLGNGVNEASWVEGDLQLLRRVPFVPDGELFRLVRLARVGSAPASVADPAGLISGFDHAFAATPAWDGCGPAESLLVSWEGDGSVAVEDPLRHEEMAIAMERRRFAFVPCDETPDAAEARRQIGRPRAGDG